MKKPVLIYGLKDKKGRFVYIGRTTDPETRSKIHRIRFPRCRFMGLERCSLEQASALEQEVIRRFKQLGQARGNVRTGERIEAVRNGKLVLVAALIDQAKRNALKSHLFFRGESVQDWIERLIDREINWTDSRSTKRTNEHNTRRAARARNHAPSLNTRPAIAVRP